MSISNRVTNSKTILAKTNDKVPEAIEFLFNTMQNEKVKMDTRVTCARALIDIHQKAEKQDVDLKILRQKEQVQAILIKEKANSQIDQALIGKRFSTDYQEQLPTVVKSISDKLVTSIEDDS